jgi:methylmalonyl-CoA carboxyltransferase small subunit
LKLKLTLDGKQYEVEIEATEAEPSLATAPPYLMMPGTARVPASAPVAAAPQAVPAAGTGEAVDEAKVCRSPVAGVVVSVHGGEGRHIQVGDTLVVMEAMKMETKITAPIAGTIRKINVAAGDSVQRGQIVVEFE